jgi:hypothetical protein
VIAAGAAKVQSAQQVLAADGANFVIGIINTSTSITTLNRSSGTNQAALKIINNNGVGLETLSANSYGVYGRSIAGNGIIGETDSANEGVLGISNGGIGLRGDSANSIGVFAKTVN